MKNRKLARFLALLFSVIVILELGFDSEAIGKKYASYSKVQKAYITEHNNGKNTAAYCYYSYLKLKTKTGVKKTMAVNVVLGMSGSLANTDIWIQSGKSVKMAYSIPGSIIKCSKNKDYILTQGTSGMGAGAYRLYKYDKKKGKYIQKYMVAYDTESYSYPERQTKALKKLEKKCKVKISKFSDINANTNRLW